jgi:hypothetical protein
MSRPFLKAAALSFATSVALLSAAPAHAEPAPVQLMLEGTKLNLAYIDTTNSSNITFVEKGEANYVESSQRGSVNSLAVLQLGDTLQADVEVDGDKSTVEVQQIQDTSNRSGKQKHKRNRPGKQKIERGMVEGNYIVVYHAGGFAYAQVSSSLPDVGRLGR